MPGSEPLAQSVEQLTF